MTKKQQPKASKLPNITSLSLEQLEALQSAAQSQIAVKRGEEARKKGLAFKTLDALNRAKRSDFRPAGEIPSQYGKKNKIYQNSRLEDAYDCPECGVVVGRPTQEPYNNIGILSGSRGTIYHCGVCRIAVGQRVTMRS